MKWFKLSDKSPDPDIHPKILTASEIEGRWKMRYVCTQTFLDFVREVTEGQFRPIGTKSLYWAEIDPPNKVHADLPSLDIQKVTKE